MPKLIDLFYLVLLACMVIRGQDDVGSLPDYVVSECYGDIFNFECGEGKTIRIKRDFFGFSEQGVCSHGRGDCIVSNPKSNSLIHRYCTGRKDCTYYMVERRGCDGSFSTYQQLEYQCVPDSTVTDVCSSREYETTSTFISSPNFPINYPPNLSCACVVTSLNPRAAVKMEIVYMAIKHDDPCRDWLRIGRRKTCGTSVDLFRGRTIPIEFHSDSEESHSGFWLYFQSSVIGSKLLVRCGDKSSLFNATRRAEGRRHPGRQRPRGRRPAPGQRRGRGQSPPPQSSQPSHLPRPQGNASVYDEQGTPTKTKDLRMDGQSKRNSTNNMTLIRKRPPETKSGEKGDRENGGVSEKGSFSARPGQSGPVNHPATIGSYTTEDTSNSVDKSSQLLNSKEVHAVQSNPDDSHGGGPDTPVSDRKTNTEPPQLVMFATPVVHPALDDLQQTFPAGNPEPPPKTSSRNTETHSESSVAAPREYHPDKGVPSRDGLNTDTNSTPKERAGHRGDDEEHNHLDSTAVQGADQSPVGGPFGSSDDTSLRTSPLEDDQSVEESEASGPSGDQKSEDSIGVQFENDKAGESKGGKISGDLTPSSHPPSAESSFPQVAIPPPVPPHDAKRLTPEDLVAPSVKESDTTRMDRYHPVLAPEAVNIDAPAASVRSPNDTSNNQHLGIDSVPPANRHAVDAVSVSMKQEELERELDPEEIQPANNWTNSQPTDEIVGNSTQPAQSHNGGSKSTYINALPVGAAGGDYGQSSSNKPGSVRKGPIPNDTSQFQSTEEKTVEKTYPEHGPTFYENPSLNDIHRDSSQPEEPDISHELNPASEQSSSDISTDSKYQDPHATMDAEPDSPETAHTGPTETPDQSVFQHEADETANVIDTRAKVNVTEVADDSDKGDFPYFGDGSLMTLGLIILCVCIGLGVLFIAFVCLAVYIKRKRRRTKNEETQTPRMPRSIISESTSGGSDNDSGRELLASMNRVFGLNGYRKGTGHQTRLNIDSIRSNASQSDKGFQVDFAPATPYDEMLAFDAHRCRSPISDSDSSLYCTPPVEPRANCKGAQTGLRHIFPLGFRNYELNKVKTQMKKKKLPKKAYRGSSSGSDVNQQTMYFSDESDVSKGRPLPATKKKPQRLRAIESEPGMCSGSDHDGDLLNKRSIASMSALSEVTFIHENTPSPSVIVTESMTDESDWETKSAISL